MARLRLSCRHFSPVHLRLLEEKERGVAGLASAQSFEKAKTNTSVADGGARASRLALATLHGRLFSSIYALDRENKHQ